MDQISDDVFRTQLDALLKRQGFKKASRSAYITEALSFDRQDRDAMLEQNEVFSRTIEQQKKEAAYIPLEKEGQKAFVAWYKQTFPGSIIMMIRNDGFRAPYEKTDQLLLGLHPGAADLFIPELRLWIEMKRVKGGKLSPEQVDFSRAIRNVGYLYIMAEGLEEAKRIVSVQMHEYKNKS